MCQLAADPLYVRRLDRPVNICNAKNMDETTKKRGRGRPATGQMTNMVIRVDAETRAAIESLLRPGERRSDFARAAIEREIARRGA